MALELGILGALQIRANGREVPLRPVKQRELLAVLLIHRGEVVSRDRLLDALWGASPPQTAPKALQVYVSQLRKAHVAIETRAPGYALAVDCDAVDAHRFERLAAEGADALAAGDAKRAAALLRDGLALWRGPPLADLAHADFAQSEIARLEELRLAALESRVDADLRLGHEGLVGELEALVARHPLRERLCRQLMLALYRAGRQAEALEAYRDIRRMLVDELGIDPSRELRELERAILNQDPALGAEIAAPASHGFVGRERELQALTARLDAAIAGHGSLVLLAGEAGIGKSRLAEELAAQAAARDMRVLTGRCWEAGGAPPYWPWVHALRAYVRDRPPELPPEAAELAALLPELGAHVAPAPTSGSDPEHARFRLFDAVAGLLRAAAGDRAILVVLDDVHAADAPSLFLLRFIAQQLVDTRVVVVGTYRDDEIGPGHPLAPAELLRAPGAQRVALRGLDPGDVGRFLRFAAGRDVAVGLAGRIHAETDGNPLFVGEMARLLLEEGGLDGDGATPAPRRLPKGVRDVIGRRVRRLSPECRDLLLEASVLGRDLLPEAIEGLTGATRDQVLDAVDEAVAAHVVEELGERGRVRFTHALVRDALYDELPPARRARLHRRAGAALEALYATDPEPHLAELAHHFCAAADAGSATKTVSYAERAAARAAGLLAYEEAARLYGMALGALEREAPGDAAWQCRLLVGLGEAQTRAGEALEARTTYHRAARIAARAGLAELLAQAAIAPLGRFLWSRADSDPEMVPLIREALDALGGIEHPLRAKLMARLVPALRGELAWEPRAALGEEAVAMARRLGDAETLAYVLSCRCGGLEGPYTLEQTADDAAELIALGERLGDKERVFTGYEEDLIAAWLRGDMAAVAADRAALAALAQEIRQPSQHWYVATIETLVAAFEGRFADADALGEEALRIGLRVQKWQPTMYHDLQLWARRAEQGRLAELDDAVRGWQRANPGYRILDCLEMLELARAGRRAEARDALDAVAADDFAGLSPDELWLWGATIVTEVCALLGAADHAADLYARLAPHDGLVAMTPWEAAPGAVSRFLGVLATVLELWHDAARHFDDALALDTRIGARPAAAHDRREHGVMLARRGVDRGRSRALLQQAAQDYAAMGIVRRVEDAAARPA